MVFDLLIKPISIFDVEEAVEYYEEKMPGLGERFYNRFLSSLDTIQKSPFIFSYLKKPVRRCKITDFPYKVLYLIQGQSIFILGITHAKRSNAFIKKRLKFL